jgi:hypothetical protein
MTKPAVGALAAYPAPCAAFEQRRDAVVDTLEHYDLNKDTTTVIGGAALALHGLHSYVPDLGELFDVDMLVPDDRMNVAYATSLDELLQAHLQPNGSNILPISPMRYSYNVLKRSFMGSPMYEAILSAAIQPSPSVMARAMLPVDAARCKLDRSEPKDVIGLLQAHMVAVASRHPVARQCHWRRQIGYAADLLYVALEEASEYGKAPEWAYRLEENKFKHRAFRNIV